MGNSLDSKGNFEKLITYCGAFKKRILCAFSIETLSRKSPQIRKDQIWIDMDSAITDFHWKIKDLSPDDSILEELDTLKKAFNREIITKNRNRTIDKVTRNAIELNFKILDCQLDRIFASVEEELMNQSTIGKGKLPDVKVKLNELAVFIRLAEKYGLISYNDPSITQKARCFSFLTGFSESSLRNAISGSADNNQTLLSLNKDNLDNLKQIVDKISATIPLLEDNLDSL